MTASTRTPSTTSATTIPWQVDWKHPKWVRAAATAEAEANATTTTTTTRTDTSDKEEEENVATSTNTSTSNRFVVGVTSAQVTLQELPEALQELVLLVVSSGSTSGSSSSSSSSTIPSSLVLSVTLLAATSDETLATEVFLQLEDTTLGRILHSRRLQWPETLVEDHVNGNGNDHERDDHTTQGSVTSVWTELAMLPFLQPKLSQVGVVSAALCRRNPTTAASSIHDALDTIAGMGLGLGMDPPGSAIPALATSTTTATAPTAAAAQDKDARAASSSNSELLYLACITSKGLVCIYSPWSLLLLVEEGTSTSTKKQPQTNDDHFFDDNDKVSDSLATLFLGPELFSQLQHTWRPLCEPLATISLSVLDQQHNTTTSTTSTTTTITSKSTSPNKSFATLWNPWIESSTMSDRTVRNVPTQVQVAGASHLVILGQGIPHHSAVFQNEQEEQEEEVKSSSSRSDKRSERTNEPEKASSNPTPPPQLQDPSDPPNDTANTAADLWWNQEAAKELQDELLHSLDDERPWWVSAGDLPVEQLIIRSEEEPKQNNNQTKKPKRPTKKRHMNEPNARNRKNHSQPSTLSSKPTSTTNCGGGFVTFCSIAQWSERRTLFLPFVPKSVSYIAQWKGMELLLVVGDTQAVCIRMDASNTPVPIGDDVEGVVGIDTTEPLLLAPPSSSSTTLSIRRFQVLPVDLPQAGNIPGRLLCGAGVTPPALLQLFTEETHRGLVLQKTFQGVSSRATISTTHAPAHVAQVQVPVPVEPQQQQQDHESLVHAWSYLGQGWALLGTNRRVYFICWEGSTASRGATYIQELESSPQLIASSTSSAYLSNVLPLPSEQEEDSSSQPTHKPRAPSMRLPFSQPFEQLLVMEDDDYKGNNDIVIDALESISGLTYRQTNTSDQDGDDSLLVASSPIVLSPTTTSRKSFSHREKSQRLLRQCSSWTQLENTRDNRLLLERQVPVVSLRYGSVSTPHFVLTMRQLVVHNGPASPFTQVLSWLCHGQDYFTAASVALDLLHDAESLFHLWKHAEKIDEEDEQTKLEGLLDGIIPIGYGDTSTTEDNKPTATLIQLADMTVGCLTKGGLAMSKTLLKFLRSNEYYDPARACLMLVATTASSVSDDPQSIAFVMGKGVENPTVNDLLWPVRCLVEIGVARDYLSTALVLLNVTIADELRRRPRQAASMSIPGMELTKRLVSLIVASDPTATELLLGLVDDQSRSRYWQSLEHETRLVLSLIDIDNKCPLLRHSEVRGWVREELHKCLQNENLASANVFEVMPTYWLQELCVACLHNAGCDLHDLVIDLAISSIKSMGSDTSSMDDFEFAEDGLLQHKMEIVESRNALEPASGSGGLDFDLMIPCLLLLQSRQAVWREGNYVSTQSLLDATCYLAGRHTKEEPRFVFDGATVMRQCALVGNVRAGANLIGGKNGFVLSCCDVIMLELQVSMEDAEAFFLNDELSMRVIQESSRYQQDRFELNDSHRQLLWLLDEHVLSIRTYGEFDSVHVRGRVDPVFCARSVFRAWLCLTYADKGNGSAWLACWLRARLGIQEDDQKSSHRLVCAALARALLWSTDGTNASEAVESCQMLGNVLEMESRFLVQLAKSCCGLVESVPPAVAEDVIGLSEASKDINASMSAVLGGVPSDILA